MKIKSTNICNWKGCSFEFVDGHNKLQVDWNLLLLNYKSTSLGITVFWDNLILSICTTSQANPTKSYADVHQPTWSKQKPQHCWRASRRSSTISRIFVGNK
jgi:hypothetical protein